MENLIVVYERVCRDLGIESDPLVSASLGTSGLRELSLAGRLSSDESMVAACSGLACVPSLTSLNLGMQRFFDFTLLHESHLRRCCDFLAEWNVGTCGIAA
jgi:hypothetical protein